MINRIADRLTNFICNNTKIEPDMVDVYKYGVEITLSSILNIFWVIFFSLILSDVISGIIFLLGFILLKRFSGGYHASTYFMCNAVFGLTFLLTFFTNEALYLLFDDSFRKTVLEALVTLSIIPIIAFAPVKNKFKKLDERQAKRCRVVAITNYIILAILSLFTYFCSIKHGSFMIVTLSAIAVMILFEEFLQRSGYHDD